MPIQRLNSEIGEEKAGRIKEGGMSHIWRALNVSSLDRLSHGRVAEGHLLDFPCFWLEFPIDKSPLSPSGSHRSLGRIKGRLWHGIRHAVLWYMKVSPHWGCCIIVDFFLSQQITVELRDERGLLCADCWPDRVVSHRLTWPKRSERAFWMKRVVTLKGFACSSD